MTAWARLAAFLIVGYLCMTRSFAYLGVAPLNMYIGEIALAAFLCLKPRVALGTWSDSLLRPSPLSAFGLALLVFISYGVWQMGRGILGGSSPFHVLKFFIFNYYPLYLLFGLWVGLHRPELLPKLVRIIAWAHGIYGFLWIVGLKQFAEVIALPGGRAPLLGWPGGAEVAVLALLCYERNLRAVWPVLALNLLIALAMQVRAQWVGLAFGMIVWGLLTRRFGRVIAMGVFGLAVIGTLELAGLQLPGRTGSAVSLAGTLGRAIAPIDAELAEAIAPGAKRHVGTADWRRKWWDAIWRSVHSTPMLEAFGHGYGYHLLGLLPETDWGRRSTWDTRTPHSAFYFALGYTGWVGVGLFLVLQFTIVRLLWRAFRLTGQPFGLAYWVLAMTAACFEESFDTPFRAIPFYLLVGMAMAPALQSAGEMYARSPRAQLLSATGR